jgi:hypothetical protein
MNHFLISYEGNKRSEMPEIYKHLELNNIKNIVEPFGGTCAFSYYVWKNNKEKNINYYLNDNSVMTYGIYDFIKTNTVEEITQKINENIKIINKDNYKEILKKKDLSFLEFIALNKHSRGTIRLYRETKKDFKLNKNQIEFITFIKLNNVIISNNDWAQIFKNNNNDETLIFLDPPYILSYNLFYNNLKKEDNVYEFFHINKLNTHKAKILLVLEKIWLNEILFKDFIKFEYDKLYQTSKRKSKHIIISNF